MPGRNCLLAICCPPMAQRAALAEEFEQYIGANIGSEELTAELAGKLCATYLLSEFDLAPKDTVTPLLRLAVEIRDNE